VWRGFGFAEGMYAYHAILLASQDKSICSINLNVKVQGI
jgi:hypothetical protein